MKFTGERCILNKSGKVLEKEHLAHYEFALNYVNNKKVLDVACGSGYGTELLALKASKVIGIDISEEAINYARKHFKRENISFKGGDATKLNFLRDEEFDVIVSFETIEHIPNYHQYLKEMHRLLRKGGIYLVSTPNKKDSSPNSEKPINPFHVIEFCLDDFKELLKKYFSEIKLYGRNPQIKLKKIIKRLLPQRVYQAIFPQVIRDIYNLKRASKFTNKNIENCRSFIAICRK